MDVELFLNGIILLQNGPKMHERQLWKKPAQPAAAIRPFPSLSLVCIWLQVLIKSTNTPKNPDIRAGRDSPEGE
jgi:hypothetical protein